MDALIQNKYARYVPFLILACCLVAYYAVYGAGFIWDDDDYVINNPTLRDWDGLRQIWFKPSSLPQYYPLVHTTFWIEFQLWGLDAFGYHLVNVILHGLNAFLVYRLLRHLEVPGALFAAMLFALHPVHVESVAWITERKNVLSALFYLLALGSYLRWRPVVEVKSSGKKYGVLAFVFFICALASKSVTLSLPAVVLLLVYWKRGRVSKSDWVASLPFFVVGILYGVFTAFLERTHVKAVGIEFDYDIFERILIAGRACWFYIAKLCFPYPISFNYARWEIDASSLLQWLFPAAILVVLGLLFAFRKKIGRGPLVAALFFGGTLLPALGFFNVFPMRYSFVADHFQYLASLGPLTLFAAGAAMLTQGKLSGYLQAALAGLVLLVLGTLTFQQAKVYEGHETLWRDTLKKNPTSWLALNNLAKVLMDRGEKAEPIELLNRALQIRSSFEAHTNLGVLEHDRGQNETALYHFDQAIALKPAQPAPYNNKASILLVEGELEEALTNANTALALEDKFPAAYVTRGKILYMLGRMKEAYQDLDKAIRMSPEHATLQPLAADAAFQSGDLASALTWSANALLSLQDDPKVQRQFPQILIQFVLSKAPEERVPFCQSLFSQLGEASRPGFVQLIQYLEENGREEEASQIAQALNFRSR